MPSVKVRQPKLYSHILQCECPCKNLASAWPSDDWPRLRTEPWLASCMSRVQVYLLSIPSRRWSADRNHCNACRSPLSHCCSCQLRARRRYRPAPEATEALVNIARVPCVSWRHLYVNGHLHKRPIIRTIACHSALLLPLMLQLQQYTVAVYYYRSPCIHRLICILFHTVHPVA